MGYSHYIYHTKPFSDDEWDRVVDAFGEIAERAMQDGIALSLDNGATTISSHERINRAWLQEFSHGPRLAVNGYGDDSHETFIIHKNGVPRQPWWTPDSEGFDSCKTAGKPYDTFITAFLCWCESQFPGYLNVASDGDRDEWTAGLDLALRTFPDANLDLPESIE
jgi:hypothetical protein